MENVEFNTRYNKTKFGEVWYVSATNHTFKFAIYKYDDDDDTVYLSNVFVDKNNRGKGYGNIILNTAEETAKRMNASTICLTAKKGSFAHKWYSRHGYVDLEPNEKLPGHIWMIKTI